MTRRLFAALAVLVALLLTAPAAAAQTATCPVAPDPVPYGTPFTLTLSGAVPGGYYAAVLSEAGTPGVYDPQLFGEADDTGSLTLADPDFTYLSPGTVKVKWDLLDANRNYNGGAVACTESFSITPS